MSQSFLLHYPAASAKVITLCQPRKTQRERFNLSKIKYNSKPSRFLVIMLSISLPMDSEFCNKYINYAQTNRPFKFRNLRFKMGKLVIDMDDTDLLTINGFFSSLVTFGRLEGRNPKEIDDMVGKGDYHEIALLSRGNSFISEFVPIVLSNAEDFEWMAECALCTVVNPLMGKMSRIFQTYSFGDDVSRTYGIDLKLATEAEYLKKAPKMVSIGKPDDESKLERYCADMRGLTYLLRQDLLPPELDQKIAQLYNRTIAIASKSEVRLDAVIVTMLANFHYAAKRMQSMFIVNLQRMKQWNIILKDDKILDAFLTYHFSTPSIIPVQVHMEWLMNFASFASNYEGRFVNESLLQEAVDLYKGQYISAISDLATYKAMVDEQLKTFLDYYAQYEFLPRIVREKGMAGKPKFETILQAAAIEVAAKKKQTALSSVKNTSNAARSVSFYDATVAHMTEIWERSSGNEPFYPIETFQKVVRAIYKNISQGGELPF